MSDKPETAVWVRPSGKEITINCLPATIEYAESLGWERKGAEKKAAPATPKAKEREMSDEEAQLRAEYEGIVGKPAHWNASKDTMEKHIAKAKEGSE